MPPARARIVVVAASVVATIVVSTLAGPIAPAARADAILVSGGAQRFPTAVDVDVAVRAQVESTTYVLAFAPLTARASHSLTLPSPAGAVPIGVDVDRGDGFEPVPVEAVAPAAAAGGASDPALVAWHGTTPLVAELEDLGPGPLTVRVRFVRLLRRVGGEVAFDVGARRCPARDLYDPGARVQVHVRVATDRDLALFTATGGTGTTLHPGVRFATAETAATDLTSDEVVHVRYREQGGGIHAQLVAHRMPDADPMGGDAGYFLLLVDADMVGAGVPRTVGMVLDRSGSMAGDKIAQARAAARVMLDHLRPADRFALHAFDDEVESFAPAPVASTPANLAAARAWIDGVGDRGGTDLDRGLRTGLGAPPEPDRFDALVLLSDGVATVGETDDQVILANAAQAAAGRTRIFTVSVGRDADIPLMEALARHARGRHLDLNDAQAALDLADRVRDLFEDIHDVRLTDLALTVDGIGAVDTLPEAPPDLFAGGQVAIVGRYQQPGVATVRITGQEGAQPFSQVIAADAPARIETDDVIRYVWATERVRALMAQLAEGGDAAAIQAAIEAIGVAYRIQTPFTRYAGGGGVADDPEVAVDGGTCSAGGAGAAWAMALVAVPLLRRRRGRPARPTA